MRDIPKRSGGQEGLRDDVPGHWGTDRISKEMDGLGTRWRQPVVVGEPHSLSILAWLQHSHAISPDDGPAVDGRDRAERPRQRSARQSGAGAVIGHDEASAEALARILDALKGFFAASWFVDRTPVPGIPFDDGTDGRVIFLLESEFDRML